MEFLKEYWWILIISAIILTFIISIIIFFIKYKKVSKKIITKEATIKIEKKDEKISKKEDEETVVKVNKTRPQKYIISYDKNQRVWVVKKTGSSRASKRCITKAEALEVASTLSNKQNLNLTIKKKDGKFQKQN